MREEVKRGLTKNHALVPCPHSGCDAEPFRPCRGMGARVHVARRRLAEKINVEMVGSGVSLGVKIAKILSRIAARGRAGPHDSEDEGCGCGQCCSMLAHGIVAHMEGVMASDTHFTLAKETE